MSPKPTPAIQVPLAAMEELLRILAELLPGTTVWAFGSRASGTATPKSDLDLVAFFDKSQGSFPISSLVSAFEHSDLPFRVDMHDWNDLPESFRQNILKTHVVLAVG